MDLREILKRALRDHRLEIEAIIPEEYKKIERALNKLTNDVIISEWLHTLGVAEYEYHIHKGETAVNLNKIYYAGIRGGNPKLLNLYSKDKLKEIIQASSKV